MSYPICCIPLVLGCLLLQACTGTRSLLPGVYQHRGKDYVTRLELATLDSTFIYSWRAMDTNAGCHGKWTQQGDTLYLHCGAEAFPAQIAGGYLSNRTPKAVVKRGRRLYINGYRLKKLK